MINVPHIGRCAVVLAVSLIAAMAHTAAANDEYGALIQRRVRDWQPTKDERSGQWSALPSEDWYVLERADWNRLLPKDRVAVGETWQADRDTAETLLTRFYPTTELNDLGKNRLHERWLKLTAISVDADRVRARIDGRLRMKHPFYPGRDDDNFVNATIIGLLEFDPAKPEIHSLQIVTEHATYGGAKRPQPFGVAVQLVP